MPTFADSQLAQLIATVNQAPAMSASDVDQLRRETEERAAKRPAEPDLWRVSDQVLSDTGLRGRLYRPTPDACDIVVYLHGGGWTMGSVQTHDRACRRMAEKGDLVVLSVDYRLAPEHPWPAAVDDTVAALRWVASAPSALASLEAPRAVAVAGDSAGGTLAALATLRLRNDTSARPDVLGLFYANTDLTGSGESMAEKASGFGLLRQDIDWFSRQWVPDSARWSDPEVSPLYAPDLSGLPETLVITCEHDPLRDQGEAFAARLREAGVPTTLRREAGMVHNFLLWDMQSPACARAADRVARDLAAALKRNR